MNEYPDLVERINRLIGLHSQAQVHNGYSRDANEKLTEDIMTLIGKAMLYKQVTVY